MTLSTVDTPAIVIRQAVESDVALIMSSWLRSYWNATAIDSGIAYEDYQAGQRARIKRLLSRVGAGVLCSPAAPDTIMAWACMEPDHLAVHYVYAKHDYRPLSVAKHLLILDGQVPRYATHMTPAFRSAFPKVTFNPYLLEQT